MSWELCNVGETYCASPNTLIDIVEFTDRYCSIDGRIWAYLEAYLNTTKSCIEQPAGHRHINGESSCAAGKHCARPLRVDVIG